MSTMTPSDMLSEIKEINLSYLLLVQRMLREDKCAIMRHMGISEPLAEVLSAMTPAQAVRLAGGSQMLCRFRFDDHALLTSLADKLRSQRKHAAALLAGEPLPAAS